MTPIARILCPVDFSEFSRHALERAAAIARACGATITVLHVLSPTLVQSPAGDAVLHPPFLYTDKDLRAVRAGLASFAEASIRNPVDTAVVIGPIAVEIVRFALALPADLIVIGTHGHSGFERLLLGSVAERVLSKAPCPVLTVPQGTPDETPARPAPFTRVLCPVDFSPSSMKALEYASSFSSHQDGRLAVLHVVEPAPILDPAIMGGPGTAGYAYTDAAVAVGRARLHDCIAHQPGEREGIVEAVAIGKPYPDILRYADEFGADLIVIGAHGGAGGLLAFGSTTNQVVRRAKIPVLTVRA